MMHITLPRSFHRRPTFIAMLLAGTILASGIAWHEATADTPAPLGGPPVVRQAGFADLVAKVRPAVVNISTSGERASSSGGAPDVSPDSPLGQMLRQFFGPNWRSFSQQQSTPVHALGSGFIIDPAGYIATNNHVIDGSQQITVTLEDGSTYNARIIGRDKKTDLALLKIDAGKPLPYVAFGNSDQEQVGDWVVAVGNPFGLGGTVTAGIVSAHGRNIDAGPYDDFLQIDAPINPGNSGGPLFNQSGQVIGIDTAIYSPNGGSVGIGFAIPSNLANDVIAQLREHGEVARGWLGVQMQALTLALAKAVGVNAGQGVLVDEIFPESPAAKADLRQGDVITAYNGSPIHSPRDLAMAVAGAHAGSDMSLTIWRDGQTKTVDVSIAAQKTEKTAESATTSHKANLGMSLARLTGDERDQLGLDAGTKGVLVAQVTAGSRAAESGVRAGDVIMRIGPQAVVTPGEAAAAIHAAETADRKSVPVLVSRAGSPFYLALQLANG